MRFLAVDIHPSIEATIKIDVDYLKTILDKFVESETQYIETSIFNELLEDEKIFYFIGIFCLIKV